MTRVKELKIKPVQDFPVFHFVELQDNKLLKTDAKFL